MDDSGAIRLHSAQVVGFDERITIRSHWVNEPEHTVLHYSVEAGRQWSRRADTFEQAYQMAARLFVSRLLVDQLTKVLHDLNVAHSALRRAKLQMRETSYPARSPRIVRREQIEAIERLEEEVYRQGIDTVEGHLNAIAEGTW